MRRMALLACAVGLAVPAPGLARGEGLLPGATGDLRRTAVVEAVERTGPAVVNISCEELVRHRVFTGDDAESFFRDFFEPKYKSSMEPTSLGSGVIIDAKGYVLTNFHVVQRGARIKVTLMDRREYNAKVLGTDPDLDLAVLRIEPDEPLPSVKIGDSSALLPGEPVIAIGNPFGLSQTVTTGIVSATHRNLNAGEGVTFYDFVQTDAAINPGNSGGALLNIYGDLIGINTAIYQRAQGIGFAIPINRAFRIAQDVIKYGEVRPAYVGMELGPVDDAQAKAAGLRRKEGVLVVSVEDGGPAQKAGIRANDIILAVENFPVMSAADYSAKMRDYTAGNTIRAELVRGKEHLNVTITAGEIPLVLADKILRAQVGIVVEDITQQNAGKYRVKGGGVVITSVDSRAQAGKARLQPGDVIRQVDAVSVEDLEGLRRQVIKARRRGTVEFLIERGRARDVIGFKI
ncbi:MAG: trypsin-like peptidase domain-containing protein [Deltaproteobacteria bacterium]|nr:trypsin-like peptidase domain-containing protein [Deltaproteobacteria bacterium]